MYSKCQRLFRSPSMPCSVIRPILKRLERPHDRDLPTQNKRRRSVTPPEEQQEAEEPVGALLGRGWAATVQVHPTSTPGRGLWQRARCRERGGSHRGMLRGSLAPDPGHHLPCRKPVSSAPSPCVTMRLRLSWTVTTGN